MRALLLALALLLWAGPSRAELVVVDEPGALDAAMAEAAAPLVAAGARVLVAYLERGRVPDLNRLLADRGLVEGGRLDPKAVVVFASRDDRFAFIRVGSDWQGPLGATVPVLRANALAPGVEAGDAPAALLRTVALLSGAAGGEDAAGAALAGADPFRSMRTGLIVAAALLGLATLLAVRRFGLSEGAARVGIYVTLGGLALYSILPFVWMGFASFKPLSEIFAQPPSLLSENMGPAAYLRVWDDGIARIVANTFVVAAAFTAVTLATAAMAGYGFAKYDFPGRRLLFRLVLLFLLVPGAVTLIPTFFIMTRLGWVDTVLPLVVPAAANAYAIFFMRQYMMAVPDELIDAARIDGCGDWGVFWRIVLPLVTPGLVALGLISFMAMWNNYLSALVYLRTPELWTLPLYQMNLTSFVVNARPWPEWMAVGDFNVVPTLLVYALFQRRFAEGIAAGAVK